MKTIINCVISIGLALLAIIPSFAVTYTAVATGNWISPTTWANSMKPDFTILAHDTIVIPAGIAVYVNTNVTVIGSSSLLLVDGSLSGSDNSLDVSRGNIQGNGDITVNILDLGLISTYDFSGTISAAKIHNRNSNLFLSSSIHVHDTLILHSGSLSMGNNAHLILDSNAVVWIKGGYLIADPGTFSPMGNYDLILTGESIIVESSILHPQLRNLTINMTSGQQQVYLKNAAILSGKLALLTGVLIIEEDLTLGDSSSIEGGSTESYIITSGLGSLIRKLNAGGDEVLFPVGTNKSYTPAVLRQSLNGDSGNFMVRAMDGVFTQGIIGNNIATSKNLVNRSWVIAEQGSFNVDLEMELIWPEKSEVNAFNRSYCFISRYAINSWDIDMASKAFDISSKIFSQDRQHVAGGGIFAVVSDAITGVKNELGSSDAIRIYPNPAPDGKVNISTQLASNDELKTEVYSMDGKKVFEQTYFGNYVTMDIGNLPNGSYLLRLYNEGELFKPVILIR